MLVIAQRPVATATPALSTSTSCSGKPRPTGRHLVKGQSIAFSGHLKSAWKRRPGAWPAGALEGTNVDIEYGPSPAAPEPATQAA